MLLLCRLRWRSNSQCGLALRWFRKLITHTSMVSTVISQICASNTTSSTCLALNPLFRIPVLFNATCLNKTTFSISLKNRACIGVSGNHTPVTTPINTVTTPKTTNMIRHPSSPPSRLTCWNAYDSTPPTICPSPSPPYQAVKRGACSDFVYHRLLISISEGAMEASKMPRKMRAVRRVQ